MWGVPRGEEGRKEIKDRSLVATMQFEELVCQRKKPLKVACMWILRSWKKIWSLLKNKKRVNIREISDCW